MGVIDNNTIMINGIHQGSIQNNELSHLVMARYPDVCMFQHESMESLFVVIVRVYIISTNKNIRTILIISKYDILAKYRCVIIASPGL